MEAVKFVFSLKLSCSLLAELNSGLDCLKFAIHWSYNLVLAK
jgi:hypothetical protein